MAINLDKLQRWKKAPLNMVRPMELEKALPVRMSQAQLDAELRKIGDIIERIADPDILSGSVVSRQRATMHYGTPGRAYRVAARQGRRRSRPPAPAQRGGAARGRPGQYARRAR